MTMWDNGQASTTFIWEKTLTTQIAHLLAVVNTGHTLTAENNVRVHHERDESNDKASISIMTMLYMRLDHQVVRHMHSKGEEHGIIQPHNLRNLPRAIGSVWKQKSF